MSDAAAANRLPGVLLGMERRDQECGAWRRRRTRQHRCEEQSREFVFRLSPKEDLCQPLGAHTPLSETVTQITVGVDATGNFLEKSREIDIGENQADSLTVSLKNGQASNPWFALQMAHRSDHAPMDHAPCTGRMRDGHGAQALRAGAEYHAAFRQRRCLAGSEGGGRTSSEDADHRLQH